MSCEKDEEVGYRKIYNAKTLPLSKFFCQKFAINWTSACHIPCQTSGNPCSANATLFSFSTTAVFLYCSRTITLFTTCKRT